MYITSKETQIKIHGSLRILKVVRFLNSIGRLYVNKLGKSRTLHWGISKCDLDNPKEYMYMYECNVYIYMGHRFIKNIF